jgi:hypothetical protein
LPSNFNMLANTTIGPGNFHAGSNDGYHAARSSSEML